MNITFFAKKITLGKISQAIEIASNNMYLKDCNIFIDIEFEDLNELDFKRGKREGIASFKLSWKEEPDMNFSENFIYLGQPAANKDYIINAAYESLENNNKITLCWSNKTNSFFEILFFDYDNKFFFRLIPVNTSLWD